MFMTRALAAADCSCSYTPQETDQAVLLLAPAPKPIDVHDARFVWLMLMLVHAPRLSRFQTSRLTGRMTQDSRFPD